MSLQFYRLDPPLESCLPEFTCQKFQLCVKTLGADTSIVIFTDKSVTTAIMRRKNVEPRGWGGGGYPGFQMTRMIEWGQKSNPPQNPLSFKVSTKYHMLQHKKKHDYGITRKIHT